MTKNELSINNINPEVQVTLGKAVLKNEKQIKDLLATSKKYKGIVITTEEDAKFVKATRTQMNKLIGALDDKRKDLKNEMYEPIEAIEKQINELKKDVFDTWEDLDVTYKGYEQKLRDEKQKEIDKLMKEHAEGRDLEHNPKWLNKGYTINAIITDIRKLVSEAEELEAEVELNEQMIIKTCEANDVESTGYLQTLKTGVVSVMDIIDTIIQAGAEKRRKAEELAEQQRLAEEQAQAEANKEVLQSKLQGEYNYQVSSTKDGDVVEVYQDANEVVILETETGEIVFRVAEFRATKSQLKMIDDYAKSIGVEMMPHACQNS